MKGGSSQHLSITIQEAKLCVNQFYRQLQVSHRAANDLNIMKGVAKLSGTKGFGFQRLWFNFEREMMCLEPWLRDCGVADLTLSGDDH